jgi:hypothetical protein
MTIVVEIYAKRTLIAWHPDQGQPLGGIPTRATERRDATNDRVKSHPGPDQGRCSKLASRPRSRRSGAMFGLITPP